MEICDQDIKVHIKLIKPGDNEDNDLLANATIVICDCVEIHGWTISASQFTHRRFMEQIWIQPPRYKFGSLWKYTVFIKNPKLFEQIEEKIFNAFSVKRYSSTNGENEEGEMPF